MNSGVLITAIICVSILTISIIPMIQNYYLQKEKIKADVMVRAEEINAKNQLELEKIQLSNNPQSSEKTERSDEETSRNPRVNKEKL